MDWHTAGRVWLQEVSNRFYRSWLSTRNGKSYQRSGSKGSPYKSGFHLPDWFHDAIDALNRDQEERFKAIKLMYAGHLHDHERYLTRIN